MFLRSRTSLLQSVVFTESEWTNVYGADTPKQVLSQYGYLIKIKYIFSIVCLFLYFTFSMLSFEQSNKYDCGVFTCAMADCISRSAPFNFGQAEMQYFRKRLVVEIVKNKFLS